jgi:predicted transcriptional regulator
MDGRVVLNMETEKPNLGEQELEVLRFIAAQSPITAREVVEAVGQERGLARTTVLTVIERLRKKGYLTRKRREGVFVYSPRVPQAEVLQDLVRHFVEKTLGGAVSPVVAYLASIRELPQEDLDEMQRLVGELKAESKEEKK